MYQQSKQLHFTKVIWRKAPRKSVCCFGLWTRRRRRDLALSISESCHSPQLADSSNLLTFIWHQLT